MEAKKIDFTEKERAIIGDFVHSREVDTLIISDVTNLLDVLNNHCLLDNYHELTGGVLNKVDGIVEEIKNILFEKVSEKQGIEIMTEYFGG